MKSQRVQGVWSARAGPHWSTSVGFRIMLCNCLAMSQPTRELLQASWALARNSWQGGTNVQATAGREQGISGFNLLSPWVSMARRQNSQHHFVNDGFIVHRPWCTFSLQMRHRCLSNPQRKATHLCQLSPGAPSGSQPTRPPNRRPSPRQVVRLDDARFCHGRRVRRHIANRPTNLHNPKFAHLGVIVFEAVMPKAAGNPTSIVPRWR